MAIYVVMNKHHVSLYEIHTKLNHFSVILHVSLHVVMYVTEKFRM